MNRANLVLLEPREILRPELRQHESRGRRIVARRWIDEDAILVPANADEIQVLEHAGRPAGIERSMQAIAQVEDVPKAVVQLRSVSEAARYLEGELSVVLDDSETFEGGVEGRLFDDGWMSDHVPGYRESLSIPSEDGGGLAS